MSTGAVITNGTDAPVERVDPIASFYSRVTRKPTTGDAFYPELAMSRTEALRSYTLNNAFAAYEDDVKGSITVGKLADITILDQDIMTIPSEQIKDAKVLYKNIGGTILYQR